MIYEQRQYVDDKGVAICAKIPISDNVPGGVPMVLGGPVFFTVGQTQIEMNGVRQTVQFPVAMPEAATAEQAFAMFPAAYAAAEARAKEEVRQAILKASLEAPHLAPPVNGHGVFRRGR